MKKRETVPVLEEESQVFEAPHEIKMKAYIKTMDEYRTTYERSIKDPMAFGGKWRISSTGIKNGIRSQNGTSTNRRSSGSKAGS